MSVPPLQESVHGYHDQFHHQHHQHGTTDSATTTTTATTGTGAQGTGTANFENAISSSTGGPGGEYSTRQTRSNSSGVDSTNTYNPATHTGSGGLTADDLPGRDTTGAPLENKLGQHGRTTAGGLASAANTGEYDTASSQTASIGSGAFERTGEGESRKHGKGEHEHGLVREAQTSGVGVGLPGKGEGEYGASEPAPYGQRLASSVEDRPREGLAGAPAGVEGGARAEARGVSENSARRDDSAVAASEGSRRPGEETTGTTGPGGSARAGAGGSKFAESNESSHAGPKLSDAVEGTAREKELRQTENTGAKGAAGEGDYVPQEGKEGVYTAPHGYSSTGAQKPSGLNELPIASDVKQVPEGGVALHGKTGLPEGKPNVIDRLVGKAQQEIGRQTENWEMYGKGVLREAGGAKAAKGEARADL